MLPPARQIGPRVPMPRAGAGIQGGRAGVSCDGGFWPSGARALSWASFWAFASSRSSCWTWASYLRRRSFSRLASSSLRIACTSIVSAGGAVPGAAFAPGWTGWAGAGAAGAGCAAGPVAAGGAASPPWRPRRKKKVTITAASRTTIATTRKSRLRRPPVSSTCTSPSGVTAATGAASAGSGVSSGVNRDGGTSGSGRWAGMATGEGGGMNSASPEDGSGDALFIPPPSPVAIPAHLPDPEVPPSLFTPELTPLPAEAAPVAAVTPLGDVHVEETGGRRSRLFLVVAIVVLLAAVIVTFFFLRGRHGGEAAPPAATGPAAQPAPAAPAPAQTVQPGAKAAPGTAPPAETIDVQAILKEELAKREKERRRKYEAQVQQLERELAKAQKDAQDKARAPEGQKPPSQETPARPPR